MGLGAPDSPGFARPAPPTTAQKSGEQTADILSITTARAALGEQSGVHTRVVLHLSTVIFGLPLPLADSQATMVVGQVHRT